MKMSWRKEILYEFDDKEFYLVYILKSGWKIYSEKDELMIGFWNWCWDKGLTNTTDYYSGARMRKEMEEGNLILI